VLRQRLNGNPDALVRKYFSSASPSAAPSNT
jgi:hypothetical protein